MLGLAYLFNVSNSRHSTKTCIGNYFNYVETNMRACVNYVEETAHFEAVGSVQTCRRTDMVPHTGCGSPY